MASILKINPQKSATFEKPILTFDLDWAHDDIIADCLNLVSKSNAGACWMITHNTDLLADLRSNQRFELGIHPNFNTLLEGRGVQGGGAEAVLDTLLEIVPETLIVRSHSLVQSSRLTSLFFSRGIKYESNDYIPASVCSRIWPWRLECGMVKVPYFFTDETACSNNSRLIDLNLHNRRGLKVFTFHPIHVFLNTESLTRYESTRHLHKRPKELVKYRYDGYGTRNRLVELLQHL
jgi:hypothetical protein